MRSLFEWLSVLHANRWIANVDRPRLQRPNGDATCAQNGALADMDARSNIGFRRNPSVIADYDFHSNERHVRQSVVMSASTEMRSLTNGHPITDSNLAQCIEDRSIANRSICPNGEIPWLFNSNGGMDPRR